MVVIVTYKGIVIPKLRLFSLLGVKLPKTSQILRHFFEFISFTFGTFQTTLASIEQCSTDYLDIVISIQSNIMIVSLHAHQ